MSLLTLSDIKDGFRIDNSNTGKFVEFYLNDQKQFEARTNTPNYAIYNADKCYHHHFVDYHSSRNYISHVMYHAFEGTKLNFKKPLKPLAVKKVTNWVKLQWTKMLAKRIAEKLNLLRQKIDPEVLNFQKKLFSVVGPTSVQKNARIFSERNHVSKICSNDIARKEFFTYNAAALAYIHYYHHFDIEKFYNWMQLYSYNKKVYSNLAKTLLAVPSGIGAQLFRLRSIKLERPVTSKTELRALLKYTSLANLRIGFIEDSYYERDFEQTQRHLTNDCRNFNCFMYASKDRLNKAAELVGNSLHIKINTQSTAGLNTLVRYLYDYPEGHNGEIVGLARKSIDWHRTAHQTYLEQSLNSKDKNRATAKPPIDLPDNKHIRLLSTVQDVITEGVEMQHCIGGYAEYAVNGSCFLFSIVYNGERASAEVSPHGEIRQCYGPQNSKNKAVNYATRVLREWGKGLSGSGTRATLYNYAEPEAEADVGLPF